MGMRGPKSGQGGAPSKPTRLKVLEGNPGKRPLNDNEPIPDGDPIKPGDLNNHASEMWDMLIRSMPDGMYTTADTAVLTAYCRAWGLAQAAAEIVHEEGFIVDGKQHPLVAVINQHTKVFTSLIGQLGCSPAARVNLKAPAVKAKSRFQGLIR